MTVPQVYLFIYCSGGPFRLFYEEDREFYWALRYKLFRINVPFNPQFVLHYTIVCCLHPVFKVGWD